MLTNNNQNEFSDFVEKFSEYENGKTMSWVKKWLIIQNHNFIFYSKKPAYESDINEAGETYHIDKPIVKCFNEYKTVHLKNKKNYVCVVSSCSGISQNSQLIFSVKSEKILHESKVASWTKRKLSKKLFANVNHLQDKSTYNTNNTLFGKLKSSSDKKENESGRAEESEKTQGKENFNHSNAPNQQPKNSKKKIPKHKKNFSCGNYESDCIKNKSADQEITSKIVSTEAANHNRFKSTNSFIFMEKEKNFEESNMTCRNVLKDVNTNKLKFYGTNKDDIFKFKSNENSLKKLKKSKKNVEEISNVIVPVRKRRKHSCQIIKNTTKLKMNEIFSQNEKSSDSLSSLEKITPLSIKNSSLINNEENSSLSRLINNMLISSKKVYKVKQRVTDSFVYLEGVEKDIYECSELGSNNKNKQTKFENSGNHKELNEKNSRTVKRKKQINKIIKLSLPKTENSSDSRDKKFSFHFNKLNFNQSLINNEADEVSANMNIDISNQEEISFDDKDYEESKSFRISQIIKRIENFEEFIYDPYSLKKLLKSFNLKKKDIGLIYNGITDEKQFLKSQFLTEMIALISKKFLSQSITKSLEIVLKEKEINKNYLTASSHQHSIEYCIVDVFNTFLGSNKESEEFYNKILPNYLTEIYLINFQLNLKLQISIPNLFVLMEYHNKIYFNDNIEINFADISPFVVQDIKYISPYQINKWFKISYMDSKIGNEYSNDANKLISEGTTNIKRIKYINFEMSESFDKILQQFKDTEKSCEEMRISLIKNINFHILNKRSELSLKLCDFYLQKFADTIFLNPIIYLILSEIYSEIFGVKLSRMIFQKGIFLLNWQFPGENNPLLIDLNYTFSLILMKHSVNLLEDEAHKNDNKYLQFEAEILQLLEKSKNLCEKFFLADNEKMAKIILQINYVKISNYEFDQIKDQFFNIKKCVEEIVLSLDILHRKDLFREEASYLNLFSDIFTHSCYFDDEIKIIFLQRLHEVKKLIKINEKS